MAIAPHRAKLIKSVIPALGFGDYFTFEIKNLIASKHHVFGHLAADLAGFCFCQRIRDVPWGRPFGQQCGLDAVFVDAGDLHLKGNGGVFQKLSADRRS